MAKAICEVVRWDGFNREHRFRTTASQAEALARQWVKDGALRAEVHAVTDTGEMNLILRLERGASGTVLQTFPVVRTAKKRGEASHGPKVPDQPER